MPDGDCEVVAATAGVEVKSFYKHTSRWNTTGGGKWMDKTQRERERERERE